MSKEKQRKTAKPTVIARSVRALINDSLSKYERVNNSIMDSRDLDKAIVGLQKEFDNLIDALLS